MNDYRNRVELPTMGVFLQPDPIGFKGDAANIYRFCGNNAVNRIDPLGLIFTAEIVLRENLDNLADINPVAFGGTAGTLNVRAEVINNHIVFHDVDIQATSYVRTRMRYGSSFTGYAVKNRSKQDIMRTVRHEGTVHLPLHENYYKNTKDAMKRDFEDGKSYTKTEGDAKIASKQESWREKYRSDWSSKGKEADSHTGAQRDNSTTGNDLTPSGATGLRNTSAEALDAALKTLMSVGGGEPGEGLHPRGPN